MIGSMTLARLAVVGRTTIGATNSSKPPRARNPASATAQVDGRASVATSDENRASRQLRRAGVECGARLMTVGRV
jgi:hypothetical protein